MRNRKISLVLALALCALPAMADNSQQQKMKDCNAQATAKNLKGDERKTFMSSCLSSAPAAPPAKMTQQEKMTDCNKQATAKGLKGDDRKSFMSTCLSGSTK
jgi:psiF repeat